VSPYNLRTFTAAEAEQEAQPVGSSAAAAGQVEQKQGQQGLEQAQVIDLTQEREDEGGQPSAKRLRMGKEAARSPASATARGSSQQGSQTAQQPSEAERRAAEAEGAPSLPTADGPRATLIVCPVSVMSNWATQLAEHCSGTLAGASSGRVWLAAVGAGRRRSDGLCAGGALTTGQPCQSRTACLSTHLFLWLMLSLPCFILPRCFACPPACPAALQCACTMGQTATSRRLSWLPTTW
jgi:hypothetical protein